MFQIELGLNFQISLYLGWVKMSPSSLAVIINRPELMNVEAMKAGGKPTQSFRSNDDRCPRASLVKQNLSFDSFKCCQVGHGRFVVKFWNNPAAGDSGIVLGGHNYRLAFHVVKHGRAVQGEHLQVAFKLSHLIRPS